MRPAYEEQVRAFAEQYLPSEGIKLYTEIKDGYSGAADETPALNEISAVTYIFMDDALCSEQYETFLEAVSGWLAENCQGVPVGIYLRVTEPEAWQQIDRANYEEKIRGRHLYRRGRVRDLRKWESDGVLTGDLSSWQRSAFTADEVTFSSMEQSLNVLFSGVSYYLY